MDGDGVRAALLPLRLDQCGDRLRRESPWLERGHDRRPEYVRRYADEISRYQNRHRVKSGITGWAQIHGLRGQTPITGRVECDNHYIQNWSLRLDLRVVLITITQLMRLRRERAAEPASSPPSI
jgi:Bacterial sugar transferase